MNKGNIFNSLLKEGDLRTTGNVKEVLSLIKSQKDFDELFKLLFSNERTVVMRAADAIEKVSINDPVLLQKHKAEILKLLFEARNIELKWHIAQLIPRLQLNKSEYSKAWNQLFSWTMDKSESRITRVNSMEALFRMSERNPGYGKLLPGIIAFLKREKIPSLLARIRKYEGNIKAV